MASTVASKSANVPEAPLRSWVNESLFVQYAAQSLKDNVAECQNDIPVLADASTPTLQKDGVVAPMITTLSEEKNMTRERTFKVGIIGAGVAGLFTAYLFDYMKKKYNLNVEYEILEANGEDRVGGRLFTKYFSNNPRDYYDVGAMRFPEIPVMERTFKLFEKLGMDKHEDYKDAQPGDLIPYYLEGDNIPLRFNGRQIIVKKKTEEQKVEDKKNKEKPVVTAKAFEITGLPRSVHNRDPNEIVAEAISDFTNRYKYEGAEAFWKYLMKRGDKYSVREYLRTQEELTWNTIEWCETATFGDGWYNQGLTELVMEEINFASKNWRCVMGGAQQIAKKLAAKLDQKDKICWETPVQKIRYKRLKDNTPDEVEVTVRGEDKPRVYDAVFNSAPLGSMQHMDLEGLNLNWGTKSAIRSLGYGSSCKVGIKFKETWWLREPYNINQGGVSKTDLPLRCCVYPSYNFEDRGQEGVLLVSYSWGQEADRLAALITRESPKGEDELKRLLLHDLALLHTDKPDAAEKLYNELQDLYITHYAHDWYADEYQVGAFAYFGPGQFKDMYQFVTRNDGKHIIIGEAASAHHAWVVGALESAVRGVYQFAFRHSGESRAAHEVAQGYSDKKITEQPFGPLPAEFSLTNDVKYMKKQDIEMKDSHSAEVLKDLEDHWKERGLPDYSPRGDLARQGVLIEMIRQRQGGDLLDAKQVTVADIKPILEAVEAVALAKVVPTVAPAA